LILRPANLISQSFDSTLELRSFYWSLSNPKSVKLIPSPSSLSSLSLSLSSYLLPVGDQQYYPVYEPSLEDLKARWKAAEGPPDEKHYDGNAEGPPSFLFPSFPLFITISGPYLLVLLV
jgi:hypothetical protein